MSTFPQPIWVTLEPVPNYGEMCKSLLSTFEEILKECSFMTYFWTQPLSRINLICVNDTLYYTVTCCYIKVKNFSCWDKQCIVKIIMVARRKTTGYWVNTFFWIFFRIGLLNPILLQSNYESYCLRSPDKVIHNIRGIEK